jgi:hypothetical protein
MTSNNSRKPESIQLSFTPLSEIPEKAHGGGKGSQFAWMYDILVGMKPGDNAVTLTLPDEKEYTRHSGAVHQLNGTSGLKDWRLKNPNWKFTTQKATPKGQTPITLHIWVVEREKEN